MPKQKVVVHFGAGKYIPSEHGPPIRSGEFHFVYEPDQKLTPRYAKVRQRVKHLFLRSKGAQNTGLKRGVVHEVHIHNVFSDETIRRSQDCEELLREAARILAPNGAIYLGHTLTPEVIPQHKLEQMAQRCGLKMETLVENGFMQRRREWNDKESRILQLVMGKGGTAVGAAPGAYLARLAKI